MKTSSALLGQWSFLSHQKSLDRHRVVRLPQGNDPDGHSSPFWICCTWGSNCSGTVDIPGTQNGDPDLYGAQQSNECNGYLISYGIFCNGMQFKVMQMECYEIICGISCKLDAMEFLVNWMQWNFLQTRCNGISCKLDAMDFLANGMQWDFVCKWDGKRYLAKGMQRKMALSSPGMLDTLGTTKKVGSLSHVTFISVTTLSCNTTVCRGDILISSFDIEGIFFVVHHLKLFFV